jgi:hypothetical protein
MAAPSRFRKATEKLTASELKYPQYDLLSVKLVFRATIGNLVIFISRFKMGDR